MPYMPWVWNKVFPRIPVDAMRKPVPRIHRDRIEVTRDSAEMGEEILWEHFFPHIHDESNYSVLDATTSNPAFERFYDEHLASWRSCADARATSARRSCASCACSTCAGSSPTRASCSTCAIPIDHVASLIKQDRIWAELERDDPRQIEIIELTGHHEFGPHQVMANVGNPEVLREIRAPLRRGTLGAIARAVLGLRLRLRRQAARRRSRARAPRLHRALRGSLHRLAGDDRPDPRAHAASSRRRFAATRERRTVRSSPFPITTSPRSTPTSLAEIVATTGEVAERFDYDVAADRAASRRSSSAVTEAS